ncbi:MAG: 5-formyltetrahydrofolate cyclo-ligase [Pedosphaera sp.]|nr:5-formyltetrahydrofolate cyclo-ligase [Pedosphaera sp.]MSU44389.1 5-formyltetrahydrofolate cyclo-ligase [Pedosphaera sp.]
MSESLREAKARIRSQMRNCFDASSRAANSAALCQRVLESPVWSSAHCIMGFAPLPDEPDITPLLRAALRAGKALYLPRWNDSEDQYEAAQIDVLETNLTTGKYGILEPKAHCTLKDLGALNLVLVPGVAFSTSGKRLGRGKAHYDAILELTTGAWKFGVAFDWQVLDTIPTEPHDMCVNWIATPTRIYSARANSAPVSGL